MPSNIPLGFLVLEIIRRTPVWVWAILAALIGARPQVIAAWA